MYEVVARGGGGGVVYETSEALNIDFGINIDFGTRKN